MTLPTSRTHWRPNSSALPGTRDIYTLGAPDDILRVTLDPVRLAAYAIDYNTLRASLINANRAMTPVQVVQAGRQVEIHAGDFFRTTEDVASLIVGTRGKQPVYLADVATVTRAPDSLKQSVLHWSRSAAGEHAVAGITLLQGSGDAGDQQAAG